MVFFNYALRKLNAKIVYYGPGLCGKTTNLVWIHDHFDGGERGKMISLATEGDRTIFFDLLPIEIGSIRGMDVTLQLYTVPGQVHYNSTRQLVLRGADGVVFVADSQRAMQSSNIDSFKNLQENLLLQGISLDGFPHALQFNKRDLRDTVSMEELNDDLNRYSVPIFEAVATEGVGVQETLEGIVKLVMRNLRERYEGAAAGTRTPGFEDPSSTRSTVQVPAPQATPPPEQAPVTPPPPPQAAVTPPAAEEPFPQEPFPQEPFPQEPAPQAPAPQEQAPVTPPPQEPVVPPDQAPPPPPSVRVFSPEDAAKTVDFSKRQGPDFVDGFGVEGVDEEAPTAMYKVGDEMGGADAAAPAAEEAGKAAPPAGVNEAGAATGSAGHSAVLEVGADLFTEMQTGDEPSPPPAEPPAEPPASLDQQHASAVESAMARPDLDSTPEFELDMGEPEAAPEPLPEPPPEPVPEQRSEPAPAPPPEPVSQPAPEPTPEFVPEPAPAVAPPPVAEAAPAPSVEPPQQPIPEPAPEAVSEPAPEPMPEFAPLPTQDTVPQTPVESFADIETESPEVDFYADDEGGGAPPAAVEQPPSEGRYEDWISAPSPFAPKPHGASRPGDPASTLGAATEEVEAVPQEPEPAVEEPVEEAPVAETVAVEETPQAPSEPETIAFEAPSQEPVEFIEMSGSDDISDEPVIMGAETPAGEIFGEGPIGDEFSVADDIAFDPASAEEIQPAGDFSDDQATIEEVESFEGIPVEPATTVTEEPVDDAPVETVTEGAQEVLEEVSVEPEVFSEGVSFADFEEAEAGAPAAIEPATRRDVAVSAEDNQLHLRLQGTGAIVESGQVRELDIEVPVPGAWVGNRRVTLQLRLTLTPNTEDEDGGDSPS